MSISSVSVETQPVPRALKRSWKGAGAPSRKVLSFGLLVMRIALDAAALYAALVSVYYMRFFGPVSRWIPPPNLSLDQSAFWTNLLPMLFMWTCILLSISSLYRQEPLPFEDEIVQVLKGAFLGVLVLLAAGFLSQRFDISRLMLLMLFPVSALFLIAGKQLQKRLSSWLLRALQGESRILLLGGGKASEFLRKKIDSIPHARCLARSDMTLEQALAALREEAVSEVILTQMDWGRKEILALADACEDLNVEMKLVPSLLEYRMGEVQVDRSMALPMFRFYHASLSGADFFLKRCFDILVSSALLAVFSVPLAAICLLIKWDSPGPILYKQRRIGHKGRPFFMLKFRTMTNGAEAMLKDLKHLNEHKGPVFKMKKDPRITRVGRWLRRYSLDEVPQFLNVLRGEMSVVGPRPLPLNSGEMEGLERQYGDTAAKRHNILPGITGLWQVSGRSDLDSNQWISLDLYYLEHWSLGLDLKIILKTPAAVFSSKGAY